MSWSVLMYCCYYLHVRYSMFLEFLAADKTVGNTAVSVLAQQYITIALQT